MAGTKHEFDAVVVGAGSTGAAAALALANAGLRVAVVERRPIEEAGARWVNAAPDWMFAQANIMRPIAPEMREYNLPSVFLGLAGEQKIVVCATQLYHVDMRHLCRRLHGEATKAGVEFFGKTRIAGVEFDGARPKMLLAEVGQSDDQVEPVELGARLFVDASGMGCSLGRRIPELARHLPPLEGRDICLAAQEICRIKDRGGARGYLDRLGAEPSEALNFTGIDGGFSTCGLIIAQGLDEVFLLTGSIADGKHASGARLLAEFKAKNPWIGETIFGGAGPVPLRRPYDRQAAPGIALAGDAACQVFPAHGSGVGSGMLAARLLADAVSVYSDPGSLDAVWAYQASIQRELGARHGAYDVFRRFVQELSPEENRILLGCGLVTPLSLKAGLMQVMPELTANELFSLLVGAARAFKLAARLLPLLMRMRAVHAHYLRYPSWPDMERLLGWSKESARLFGTRPDLGDG